MSLPGTQGFWCVACPKCQVDAVLPFVMAVPWVTQHPEATILPYPLFQQMVGCVLADAAEALAG